MTFRVHNAGCAFSHLLSNRCAGHTLGVELLTYSRKATVALISGSTEWQWRLTEPIESEKLVSGNEEAI